MSSGLMYHGTLGYTLVLICCKKRCYKNGTKGILEEFIEEYTYPNLIKKNQRMSTCNWLDLQTLGFQPIMAKNLPDL
jgi:hypothetical protein